MIDSPLAGTFSHCDGTQARAALACGLLVVVEGRGLRIGAGGEWLEGRITGIRRLGAGRLTDWLAEAGLTAAEIEIALALRDGQRLAQIAAARGRSPATVKNQLRAILSKCGVRRQADLVALLIRQS